MGWRPAIVVLATALVLAGCSREPQQHRTGVTVSGAHKDVAPPVNPEPQTPPAMAPSTTGTTPAVSVVAAPQGPTPHQATVLHKAPVTVTAAAVAAPAPTTTTRPTLPVVRPTGSLAAASGSDLVVKLSTICNGMCAGPIVPSLDFAVYETGRAIVHQWSRAGDRYNDVALTAQQLSDVAALTDTVIVGPSRLTPRPGVGMADGADVIFDAWYDGQRYTLRGQDWAGLYADSDGARFDALTRLRVILRTAADAAPAYVPSGVAVMVESLPPPPPPATMQVWPLMALDTFGETLTPGSQGPRCGVVSGPLVGDVVATVAPWPSSLWNDNGTRYEVTVRPLLPGERSCGDAFA